MSDIFISYAREDREWADRLAKALDAPGRSVWWDTRLKGGEPWDEVIERELGTAGCVVVLWSKTSVQRHWVLEEAHKALERQILVPAIIEKNARFPLGFSRLHAIDLTVWNGEPTHPDFQRLLSDVANRLDAVAKSIRSEGSAASVADIAAQEHVDQRKGAEESTAASVNYDVEDDEEPDAPASCKITESWFNYSDQHVSIHACLPNIKDYAGSCAIEFTGLDDCIITRNHQDILSTLFHGHHSGVDVEKRRIIAYGPSKENKYAIDIGDTRLFLSERVTRSLCRAIDAFHEAYLEALKRIDSAWEADGFFYENRRYEAVVCLGTLSAWMWSRVVEFGREHNYKLGNSEWHMFDANDVSLEIHSPTRTRRFDEGMHVRVSANHQSPAGTSTTGMIALLWNPPLRYWPDIYPLSERRYWGAATTLRWINKELILKICEWIWSNEPRTVHWSPRAGQHRARLDSMFKDYGMLVNYERQDRQRIDLHGSLSDLQRLVATLQTEFHSASDPGYVFQKEMMLNLYHTIILCLQHVNCNSFAYIAGNLRLSGVQNENQLIEILSNKIR